MPVHRIDTDRSRVVLRTRAKGFFSALAHDLELTATISRGEAKREGETWEAEVVVEPTSIKVAGAIKNGRVSPLSRVEVEMCEKRILSEVFAGVSAVVALARGTVASPTIEVSARRTALAKLRISLAGLVVEVRGTVSLQALGLPEVKAPLNAFAVRDEVEVEASIVLLP